MTTREENLKKINAELEKLSDEELDNVAGGNMIEIYGDGVELFARGLLTLPQAFNRVNVREVLHQIGYVGYKDNSLPNNIYTDKNGNQISRDEFWKNFDAENGTQSI